MITEAMGFITITIFSAMTTLLLSLYVLKKSGKTPLTQAYLLLGTASSLYSFLYAGELASTSLQAITFWIKLQYSFVPFLTPLCLIFSIEYAGIGRQLNRFWLRSLLLLPCITVIIQLTNSRHGLFFSSIQLRPDTPFPISEIGLGLWFIVDLSYSLCCFIACIAILFLQWKRATLPFRKQISVLAISFTIPFLAGCMYYLEVFPYGIDLTPASMSLSCLLIGFAIFSFRMFSLMPIAVQTVFESMRDGILVLDNEGRIVRYNRTASQVIPALVPSIIGTSADGLLPGLALGKLAQVDMRIISEYDTELQIEGQLYHYQVRISPIIQNKNNQLLGIIISLIDITERVHSLKSLRRLASYDGLTQIYNRTYFLNQCEQVMEEMENQHKTASLLLFDIDYFKKVNDRYGHEAGDMAIKHIVQLCKDMLEEPNLFGRYGGEEFIICLPGMEMPKAVQLAEKLRSVIERSPVYYDEVPIYLTASFGVTSSSFNKSLAQLIREADHALYEAKHAGRNCVATDPNRGYQIGT
jgi:diguanylate cyclase (GGDEF)-like protein/PAS domain S-box-containing protein